MLSRNREKIFAVLAALLLAGCGFHLQDGFTAPPEMARTYVDAVDDHSLFYRELKTRLNNAGVHVVDAPGDATAILSISFDETSRRVLSVSARNVPTEYEVYYTIEYGLNAGAKNLMEAQVLTLTRDYTYDSTLVLGKEKEEETLRTAIVQDLVRIVLKQVSTL